MVVVGWGVKGEDVEFEVDFLRRWGAGAGDVEGD